MVINRKINVAIIIVLIGLSFWYQFNLNIRLRSTTFRDGKWLFAKEFLTLEQTNLSVRLPLSVMCFVFPFFDVFLFTSKMEKSSQRKKRESVCGGFDLLNGGFDCMNGGNSMIIGGEKVPFCGKKQAFLHKYTAQNADFGGKVEKM